MAKIWKIAISLQVLLSSALAGLAAPAADVYDYIVVGSGPGGGPLASNLARANYTVLLLEAGGDDSPPAFGGEEYPSTLTWDFFVKHYADKERQLKNNRLTWRTKEGAYWVGRGSDTPPAGSELLGVYYPRGATLGGSSMINKMVTFYPTESDWDYVVNITGDASWSADNMRKVFVKIEHNNYLPASTPGHGFNGYYQATMATNVQSMGEPTFSISKAMARSIGLDASKVISYTNTDPNALEAGRDQKQGMYGLPSHTYSNGQRFSSRNYVQDTVKAGFPLTVSLNSLVTRVLFSNGTDGKPQATGVEYQQGKSIYKADPRRSATAKGQVKQVTAKREVILSGGTFNTPQILLLSGVGPADQLKQFGIPLVADSPGVGTNLMDNEEMPVVGVPRGQGGGFSPASDVVMLKTKHTAPDVASERDVFIMHFAAVFRGFWPANQTNRNLPRDPAGAYGISMVKQHPQNRAGTVRLRSADPLDAPDINFNLFAEGGDTDLGAMKDVVAWARRVYKDTEAPVGPVNVVEPPCPGGADAQGYCKEDEDWIVGQTFGHHPTSTCRIGGDGDKTAVLDSKFRVRGVGGLRVVDASAFARIPGVFPVVATFMISQKASDVILEEAKV